VHYRLQTRTAERLSTQHQTDLAAFPGFRKPLYSYKDGMCHSTTQRPGTSLFMISFTRPSPRLVLQATNAGVRRPEGLGMRPANSCTTWKISAELLLVPFPTISGFLVSCHNQMHQFVCQNMIIFQGRPLLGDRFYGTSSEWRDLCHSKATPKLYPVFWSTAASTSSKYIFTSRPRTKCAASWS